MGDGYSFDYNDNFDPRITNEFLTAAFRVGHTMVPTMVEFMARQGQRRTRNGRKLNEMFFNVDSIIDGDIDELLKGMTGTAMENPDDNFSREVSDKLFDGALNGMDLIALNIQRGRDHGIPGYAEYVKICRVGNPRSFNDLSNLMSSRAVQKLRRTYRTVEDIDLFAGMFLENPGFNNGLVGPTFLCLIGDQFARLKKGDRYFYDLGNQAGSFTPAQLNEIRRTSMSRLICDNGDRISEMQPLAFQLPNSQVNRITSCNSPEIPRMDLGVFRNA